MTDTSFTEFKKFLEKIDWGIGKEIGRVADFGGTDRAGDGKIQKILSEYGLTNYHMLDFDNGIDLRKPIRGPKFHLGICMDLLEHVSDPFIVTKNIINSLKPGALLFITVPFVWQIHGDVGYNDYWRFTPQGVKELFKDMGEEALYKIYDSYKPSHIIPPYLMPPSLPWIRIVGIFKKLN